METPGRGPGNGFSLMIPSPQTPASCAASLRQDHRYNYCRAKYKMATHNCCSEDSKLTPISPAAACWVNMNVSYRRLRTNFINLVFADLVLVLTWCCGRGGGEGGILSESGTRRPLISIPVHILYSVTIQHHKSKHYKFRMNRNRYRE